jgi:heparan-alpha-glucosaminide N-acetyltransferase
MKSKRLASIDMLRALTMLFMIFVNDLWSLTDIPSWLGHASAEEDRLGFADIIFPLFMFIIGLSIPHAIKARTRKGDSKKQILVHIASRSFALIVMGLFMVNLENIDETNMIMNKAIWQLLMFFAFVMIWNHYKNPKVLSTISPLVLQVGGWVILTFLAYVYKGVGDNWMLIHWWGILGLLGWSYLICSITYLFVGDRITIVAVICVMFLLLNINELIQGLNYKLIITASNYLSVMLGVLTTVLYIEISKENHWKKAISVLAIIGIGLFVFGFFTRPEWGISKIRATPSWTAICGGISMISFIMILFITDIKGLTKWARPIAAGGSATLTCYLLPYLIYGVIDLSGLDLPAAMTTGFIGLVKSLLFGFLIIQLAEWIGKFDLKLKI